MPNIKQLGRMAAGWNAAVRELKTRVPAWVKRHSTGEGRITIRQTANTYTLTVTNSVPYGQPLLKRRADYALDGVKRGLNGSMRAIKRKILRSMK